MLDVPKVSKSEKENPEVYQDQIGQFGFKFVKFLGIGASGTVVYAIHIQTSEKVAIKIIDKIYLVRNKKLKRKVEREIAILKLLKHENLIRFRGVAQDKKNVYLVMEFAEGGELFSVIKEKKLNEEEIFLFFSQIVKGLDYLHSVLRLCHRDLKPENLLLDAYGNIKISDFGMATLMGPKNLTKTSCGSPHYASPEVIEGKSEYNGTLADVWSLGVILYAMATKSLPFFGRNIQDVRTVLDKVVRAEYSFPDGVDPDIKDLIYHMLQKLPEKRYSMKKVKQHKWFVKWEKKMRLMTKAVSLGSLSKEDNLVSDEIVEKRKNSLTEIVTEDEINSEIGKSIMKILHSMGWTDRKQVVISLQEEKKNLVSVVYRLIDTRIRNDNDALLVDSSLFSDEEMEKNVKEVMKEVKEGDSSPKGEKKNPSIKIGKAIKSFFKIGKKSKKKDAEFELVTPFERKDSVSILLATFLELKVMHKYNSDEKIHASTSDNDDPVEFLVEMKEVKSENHLKSHFTFKPVAGNKVTQTMVFESIKKVFDMKISNFEVKVDTK